MYRLDPQTLSLYETQTQSQSQTLFYLSDELERVQKRLTKILAPNSSYDKCIVNFGLTTQAVRLGFYQAMKARKTCFIS